LKLCPPDGFVKANMITAASTPSSRSPLPQIVAPMRSPRTSIILAELTRQRRFERCERRRKRQQRRRAWARLVGWMATVSRWPFATSRMRTAPRPVFPGAMPLVYALKPSSKPICSIAP
jgi:hypothetical protein